MTMHKILPTVCLFACSSLAMVQAHSHARWDPDGLVPPRTDADDIKSGPCGAAPTDRPAVLQAGATVTVEFESTIYHKGDFRIAFAEANDQGFDEHVLLEGIPDYENQRYRSAQITLPDVECERCALQLIQVMRDRTPPTNYYSCADIQLTRSGADTVAPEQVSNFSALPADGEAVLNWTAPADADYAGTLILQGTQPVTATPTDGETYSIGERLADAKVIYIGKHEAITAEDLPAGSSLHFAAFAFDTQLNYAGGVLTSVDLPEQAPNFAPEVTLHWEQLGYDTGVADTSGSSGEVIISAQVQDDNSGDNHTFQWHSVDLALEDTDSEPHRFTFDPQGMPRGIYEIQVTVTDSGEPALSSTASVFIEFAPQPRGGASSLLWLALLGLIAAYSRKRGSSQRRSNSI